ncbi:hypothetical protein EI94DRAFT_580068 [Lactarius quietus]|nr:hypothetical protein EI94DRAFT_580068 [Lactarius quietus]
MRRIYFLAIRGLTLSPTPTNPSATAFPVLCPPVMIIQLVARKSFACAQENPYCISTQSLSAQINNSTTTGATHTPILSRPNLVGVLVIAALLVLGTTLWLCFGKWSKPIRHLFKGKPRSSYGHNAGATPFGIGDGLRAVVAPKKVPGPEGADAEKAEIMDSSSSTQSTLLDQDAIKISENKVQPALPAKVLQIKPGSRLAGLVRYR